MKPVIKNKILLTLCIAIILCWHVALCAQENLSAEDIVARLNDSLKWHESFSMRVRAACTPLEGYPDKDKYERNFIFRNDAKTMQAEWIGQLTAPDTNDPCIIIDFKKVMTAPYSLEGETAKGHQSLGVSMDSNYVGKLQMILDNGGYGGPLIARIFGNGHMNIAELLKKADELSVREGLEDVGGLRCNVVEGKSKYGKVTAWISPDKGYSPVKWEIRKQHNDISVEEKPSEMDLWLADFKIVEFEQHGMAYVPKQAFFTLTIQKGNERTVSQYLYNVSEVQLNPDFPALKAFKVDLPEGTRVFLKDVPGVKHIWKNGKVVPDVNDTKFSEADKAIDGCKKQK